MISLYYILFYKSNKALYVEVSIDESMEEI